MDFTSKETACHILQPLAYNLIRKIRKPNKRVRSAYEQYTIHCTAYEFESNVLKIPKPLFYDGPNAYVMDQFEDMYPLPEPYFFHFPQLVAALVSFRQHMISGGCWPRDFSIFCINDRQFMLIDFGRFGYVDSNRVKFPHENTLYTLEEASLFYGLQIYDEYDFIPSPPQSPKCVAS